MKITAAIDRFEGDWAILVVEGKTIFQLPAAFLPANAREGSWVNLTIEENHAKEKEVLSNVKSLMDELKEGKHL